ncbi:MAG TPA: hypothetical protein VIC57_06860 [Candidatus Dormibacteraeota bacterium]
MPDIPGGTSGREFTVVGIPGLTPPEWREIGKRIAGQRQLVNGHASRQMWAVGDWLLQGEDDVFTHLNRRGVRELAAEITGYSTHTLAMAVSVARRVRPDVRVDGLSWWHHLLVGKLPAEEQERWLCRAAEEGWSVKTMRERLRAASVIAGSRTRQPDRLVTQLTRWTRAEMSDGAVSRLHEWWRREMDGVLTPSREDASRHTA